MKLARQDLNLEPPDSESGVLPIELRAIRLKRHCTDQIPTCQPGFQSVD